MTIRRFCFKLIMMDFPMPSPTVPEQQGIAAKVDDRIKTV
jgi:hypothetical protein